MVRRDRGTRPGEIRKSSLVTVWKEGATRDRLEVVYNDNQIDTAERLTYYVVEIRRLELGRFYTRVMEAKPLEGGEIPQEVLDRMTDLRKQIISQQKSDRGRAQAVRRALDSTTDGDDEADDEGEEAAD